MSDAVETNKDQKKPKDRSPNFPFIPLQLALERARQFYDGEKRGAAPLQSAAEHWGYSPTSSGALQTVSALKQYGLLADEGGGPVRKLKLTDAALRILLDQRPDSAEREEFKRQASRRPAIAQEVYEKWPDGLPSESTLRHFLLLERHFADANASRVCKIIQENEAFTSTAALATISEDQKTADEGGTLDTSTKDTAVQQQRHLKSAGQRQDVFSLDEGQVVIQWPATMSKESFEDFEDWLNLLIKKVGRAYKKPTDDGKE